MRHVPQFSVGRVDLCFWINEREMWEMGDERKVKWQFLEERERMEKCFQEGFQSDLYTFFKVLGSFFTFLKQN